MLEGDGRPGRSLELGSEFLGGLPNELQTLVVTMPWGVMDCMPHVDGGQPLVDGLATV